MQSKQRSGYKSVLVGALPIVGLIAVLLALAILQLRWSTRLSDAERARLQQNLERSTSGFQSAFARDLLRVCQTLQASEPREPQVLVDRLFDRYAVWNRISGHAALIEDLYIWPQSNGQSNVLLRFNPQTRKLEPAAWPESLRTFIDRSATYSSTLPKQPKRWLWDEQIPALIHPIYVLGKGKSAGRPQLFGYLFAVFNPQDFEQAYVPELGGRYFPPSNGFIFQLVERGPGPDRHVVYQSDSQNNTEVFEHPDAIIPLLDSSMLYRSQAGPAMLAGQGRSAVYLSDMGTHKWQISVRHRSGSVDAAVTALRHRNFAVSMVLLLVLLVSLITLLTATRRARRLAQLQMEFASGISHELRTPLAVICSAAENLADGVVTEANRVRNYGSMIHKESRRLSETVDHILDFAQLHSDAHNYQIETAAVATVVEAVLKNEHPFIQSAGVAIEVNVPDNLPLLLTDASALGQCLQNLLSNAVKYGSDGGRILLTASQAREDGAHRILLTVQDFGTGIAPEELSHIYEPFYRAGDARDSQIRGTGLGLSLTHKIIESLGGRITVESSRGKGSAFTLHIPVATP